MNPAGEDASLTVPRPPKGPTRRPQITSHGSRTLFSVRGVDLSTRTYDMINPTDTSSMPPPPSIIAIRNVVTPAGHKRTRPNTSILGSRPVTSVKKSSPTSLSLVRNEVLKEKESISFPEDPIAYFSKSNDNKGHQFIYMVYAHPRDSPLFNPYDVVRATHAELTPEYFTISSTGVTRVQPGFPTEHIELDRWTKESAIYSAIKKLKFFKNYAFWKSFVTWRRLVTRTRFSHILMDIQENPLFRQSHFYDAASYIFTPSVIKMIADHLLPVYPQAKLDIVTLQDFKPDLSLFKQFSKDVKVRLTKLHAVLTDPQRLEVHDSDYKEIKRRNPNIKQLVILEKKLFAEQTKRQLQMEQDESTFERFSAFIEYSMSLAQSEGVLKSFQNALATLQGEMSAVFSVTLSLTPKSVSLHPSGQDIVEALLSIPFPFELPAGKISEAQSLIQQKILLDFSECISAARTYEQYCYLVELSQNWQEISAPKPRDGYQRVFHIDEDIVFDTSQFKVYDFSFLEKVKEEKVKLASFPGSLVRGSIYVDSRQTKADLLPVPDMILNQLEADITALAISRVDEIEGFIKHAIRRLRKDPAGMVEEMEEMELYIREEVKFVEDVFQQGFSIPEGLVSSRNSLYEFSKRFSDELKVAREYQGSGREFIENELRSIKNELMDFPFQISRVDPPRALKKVAKLVKQAETFGTKSSDEIKKLGALMTSVYQAVDDFNHIRELTKENFSNYNATAFTSSVKRLNESVVNAINDSSFPISILNEMFHYCSTTLPLTDAIEILGGAEMRPHHWKRLFDEVGAPALKSPVTLKDIIESGILSEKVKIEAMAKSAQHEAELLTTFHRIEEKWKTTTLPLVDSQPKDQLLLSDPSYVLTEIESTQLTLAKMMSDNAADSFRNQAKALSETLDNYAHIIVAWYNFQSHWTIIATFFAREPIGEVIPELEKQYQLVKRRWTSIVKHAQENASMSHVSEFPALLEILYEDTQTLEAAGKALSRFVDKKRETIPRLCLLSDAAAVRVFSTSSKQDLCNALCRMFMRVRLDVSESPGEKVVGLVGDTGEVLSFLSPVDLTADPSVIIENLVQSMKTAFFTSLDTSIQNVSTSQTIDWVLSSTTHVCLVARQAVFSNGLEKAFATLETNSRSLTQFETRLRSKITELSTSLSLPLAPSERRRVEVVIGELIGESRFVKTLSDNPTKSVFDHYPKVVYTGNGKPPAITFGETITEHGGEFWGSVDIYIPVDDHKGIERTCMFSYPCLEGEGSSRIVRYLAAIYGQPLVYIDFDRHSSYRSMSILHDGGDVNSLVSEEEAFTGGLNEFQRVNGYRGYGGIGGTIGFEAAKRALNSMSWVVMTNTEALPLHIQSDLTRLVKGKNVFFIKGTTQPGPELRLLYRPINLGKENRRALYESLLCTKGFRSWKALGARLTAASESFPRVLGVEPEKPSRIAFECGRYLESFLTAGRTAEEKAVAMALFDVYRRSGNNHNLLVSLTVSFFPSMSPTDFSAYRIEKPTSPDTFWSVDTFRNFDYSMILTDNGFVKTPGKGFCASEDFFSQLQAYSEALFSLFQEHSSVCISGTPGSGKTLLLSHFIDWLQTKNLRVHIMSASTGHEMTTMKKLETFPRSDWKILKLDSLPTSPLTIPPLSSKIRIVIESAQNIPKGTLPQITLQSFPIFPSFSSELTALFLKAVNQLHEIAPALRTLVPFTDPLFQTLPSLALILTIHRSEEASLPIALALSLFSVYSTITPWSCHQTLDSLIRSSLVVQVPSDWTGFGVPDEFWDAFPRPSLACLRPYRGKLLPLDTSPLSLPDMYSEALPALSTSTLLLREEIHFCLYGGLSEREAVLQILLSRVSAEGYQFVRVQVVPSTSSESLTKTVQALTDGLQPPIAVIFDCVSRNSVEVCRYIKLMTDNFATKKFTCVVLSDSYLDLPNRLRASLYPVHVPYPSRSSRRKMVERVCIHNQMSWMFPSLAGLIDRLEDQRLLTYDWRRIFDAISLFPSRSAKDAATASLCARAVLSEVLFLSSSDPSAKEKITKSVQDEFPQVVISAEGEYFLPSFKDGGVTFGTVKAGGDGPTEIETLNYVERAIALPGGIAILTGDRAIDRMNIAKSVAARQGYGFVRMNRKVSSLSEPTEAALLRGSRYIIYIEEGDPFSLIEPVIIYGDVSSIFSSSQYSELLSRVAKNETLSESMRRQQLSALFKQRIRFIISSDRPLSVRGSYLISAQVNRDTLVQTAKEHLPEFISKAETLTSLHLKFKKYSPTLSLITFIAFLSTLRAMIDKERETVSERKRILQAAVTFCSQAESYKKTLAVKSSEIIAEAESMKPSEPSENSETLMKRLADLDDQERVRLAEVNRAREEVLAAAQRVSEIEAEIISIKSTISHITLPEPVLPDGPLGRVLISRAGEDGPALKAWLSMEVSLNGAREILSEKEAEAMKAETALEKLREIANEERTIISESARRIEVQKEDMKLSREAAEALEREASDMATKRRLAESLCKGLSSLSDRWDREISSLPGFLFERLLFSALDMVYLSSIPREHQDDAKEDLKTIFDGSFNSFDPNIVLSIPRALIFDPDGSLLTNLRKSQTIELSNLATKTLDTIHSLKSGQKVLLVETNRDSANVDALLSRKDLSVSFFTSYPDPFALPSSLTEKLAYIDVSRATVQDIESTISKKLISEMEPELSKIRESEEIRAETLKSLEKETLDAFCTAPPPEKIISDDAALGVILKAKESLIAAISSYTPAPSGIPPRLASVLNPRTALLKSLWNSLTRVLPRVVNGASFDFEQFVSILSTPLEIMRPLTFREALFTLFSAISLEKGMETLERVSSHLYEELRGKIEFRPIDTRSGDASDQLQFTSINFVYSLIERYVKSVFGDSVYEELPTFPPDDFGRFDTNMTIVVRCEGQRSAATVMGALTVGRPERFELFTANDRNLKTNILKAAGKGKISVISCVEIDDFDISNLLESLEKEVPIIFVVDSLNIVPLVFARENRIYSYDSFPQDSENRLVKFAFPGGKLSQKARNAVMALFNTIKSNLLTSPVGFEGYVEDYQLGYIFDYLEEKGTVEGIEIFFGSGLSDSDRKRLKAVMNEIQSRESETSDPLNLVPVVRETTEPFKRWNLSRWVSIPFCRFFPNPNPPSIQLPPPIDFVEREPISPLIGFFYSEIRRFNRAISSMDTSVVFDDKVPKHWPELAGLWGISSVTKFTKVLFSRYSMLKSFAEGGHAPNRVELRTITDIRSYLLAYISEVAYQRCVCADMLALEFSLSENISEVQPGLALKGACMIGAHYDFNLKKIVQPNPKTPATTKIPVIYVTPTKATQKGMHTFMCPVYMDANILDDPAEEADSAKRDISWEIPIPSEVTERSLIISGASILAHPPEEF